MSEKPVTYKEHTDEQYNKQIDSLLLKLPDYCRSYREHIQSRKSLKTQVDYLGDIYTFFRFIIIKKERLNLSDTCEITPQILENFNGFDFDAYINWLSNYKFDKGNDEEKWKHNTNVSKKRKLMSVKSLYNYLYRYHIISSNPSQMIETPSIKAKKRGMINILDDSQSKLFLRQIDREFEASVAYINSGNEKIKITEKDKIKPHLIKRDKAIIYLILGTGLRVSELCAIDCSNISFDLGYINVIRKGYTEEDNEKTSDQVYLSKEVMDILVDYIDNSRPLLSPTAENTDALFISSKKQRITSRSVELIVKHYADACLGTDNNIHPHTLRATFGTRYYAMTKDISATSTAMNHAGIEVTAKYYLKPATDAMKLAADLKIK